MVPGIRTGEPSYRESVSHAVRALGTFIMGLAIGCSPPVETVGNSQDSATWLRAEGPNPEGTTTVGHAFVLSTMKDYCSAFEERFRIQREASAARTAALDAAGDDPEARCEAEKTWWESRLEAESRLYFREARHTSLFGAIYDPVEGAFPLEAGLLEEGLRELDGTVIKINTLRAHRLDVALSFGLADCTSPLTQDFAEGVSGYRGPPRERWSFEAALTVTDAEMVFAREIDYRLPTPGQPDPVIEDEEPREPAPLSFSRTFSRCDVAVGETDWWHLLSWAWLGSP